MSWPGAPGPGEARVIDGRAMAREIATDTSATAGKVAEAGATPRLAVVVPTDDEGTAWYVRSIGRAAERVGVDCRVVEPDRPDGAALAARLDALSEDPEVHGVILQTPLPEGVRAEDVTGHIVPAKDVDGANPASLGRLVAGMPTWAPATAAAVAELLDREGLDLTGLSVVVVGRSTVVGKPAAHLLLDRHATVTVCHSRTRDLAAVCSQADVLVVATGRAHMVGADHVKPGAVVIDVGTNPGPDNSLQGDVDPAAATVAGAMTPVPGGVGPVTTALLLNHTAHAAFRAITRSAAGSR